MSKILFINAGDTSRHISSANAAIYPNLGLLTLMSNLKHAQDSLDLGYLDGVVCGNEWIQNYFQENFQDISIICFSSLTANYGASIKLAKLARELNNQIVTIFGNDHFSALYESVMKNQKDVCYGFYGNDVVTGFVDFVTDLVSKKMLSLESYSGLIYRDDIGKIQQNNEKSGEYGDLSFVDYSLADTIIPHNRFYLDGQKEIYDFIRNRDLKSQVVDIGRGCIKFSGRRINGVLENTCDFCGIITGSKAIVSHTSKRAWEILENVYNQGYNYFYITADELPLTLWSLLRDMADSIPNWYKDLSMKDKPKMFGYARAEAFDVRPEKIDIIVDTLGFDHFFIGFDGLSDISLRVMNKGPIGGQEHNLVEQNMIALRKMVAKGCMITAGLVITHLGITSKILEENYQSLEKIVEHNPSIFAALDFGPLCPIPGSLSFKYLTNPEFASERAQSFGLSVDLPYLQSVQYKYLNKDLLDMDELICDFIRGCCPEITKQEVDEYIKRMEDLCNKHSIVIGGGV